jgi:hypothetical protein
MPRIILKCILREIRRGGMSTRLIYCTIGKSDGLLWKRSWSTGFRKMEVNFSSIWATASSSMAAACSQSGVDATQRCHRLLFCYNSSHSRSECYGTPWSVCRGGPIIRNGTRAQAGRQAARWLVHKLDRYLSVGRETIGGRIVCNLRLEEWPKQLNLPVLF